MGHVDLCANQGKTVPIWYEKKTRQVFLIYVLVNDVISSIFRYLIKKVEKDQIKAQKLEKEPKYWKGQI